MSSETYGSKFAADYLHNYQDNTETTNSRWVVISWDSNKHMTDRQPLLINHQILVVLVAGWCKYMRLLTSSPSRQKHGSGKHWRYATITTTTLRYWRQECCEAVVLETGRDVTNLTTSIVVTMLVARFLSDFTRWLTVTDDICFKKSSILL